MLGVVFSVQGARETGGESDMCTVSNFTTLFGFCEERNTGEGRKASQFKLHTSMDLAPHTSNAIGGGCPALNLFLNRTSVRIQVSRRAVTRVCDGRGRGGGASGANAARFQDGCGEMNGRVISY